VGFAALPARAADFWSNLDLLGQVRESYQDRETEAPTNLYADLGINHLWHASETEAYFRLEQDLASSQNTSDFYAGYARVPNLLPRPTSFRGSGVETVGAVDIHYAMAPYLLQPDQALVMEGRLPRCGFANVALWNMHMQTLEYRARRTSLNRAQMRLGDDGSFRVLVAHRDPGGADWIDTEGHPIGIVFWRILLPEEEPGEIGCRVVEI
jgi:hypothetical protein